jgi:hypothetical protein
VVYDKTYQPISIDFKNIAKSLSSIDDPKEEIDDDYLKDNS